ncbi:MAG: hypothetical protein L0Y71_07405 [Gemmataceae bacterium]|nr:hypothetical protein [Gemmataceae bacterium]
MKRFFYTLVGLALAVGAVEAAGKKGGGGGGKVSAKSGKSIGGKVSNNGAGMKEGDLGGKAQVFNKKPFGQVEKNVLDKNVFDNKINAGTVLADKKFGDNKKIGDAGKGVSGKKFGDGKVAKVDKLDKFDLKGNKKVAKLPGFKVDAAKHTLFCGTFGVPKHLHRHCFFHFDFCWNHHCWLPGYSCFGYWHPYARGWYYWYAPWRCYLPYTYIETYRPVVVVEQPVVIVNGSDASANDSIEPMDPTMLPPGATTELPPGIDPTIPAPKE